MPNLCMASSFEAFWYFLIFKFFERTLLTCVKCVMADTRLSSIRLVTYQWQLYRRLSYLDKIAHWDTAIRTQINGMGPMFDFYTDPNTGIWNRGLIRETKNWFRGQLIRTLFMSFFLFCFELWSPLHVNSD